MSSELLISIIGLSIVFITNIVLVSVFFSSLNARVKTLESQNKVLFQTDKEFLTKLEVLSRLEAQLELLIGQCSLNR